ncbi:MAG: LysR family transcriptional regulator, partial [Lysobacterales bacterium 13-68-4]
MKTLDLDTVRAFVLTAELQSFTRAAQALDSTQSAVSLKLRKLEAQLGRRLLERTPRQVRLSAEGALFLTSARELIAAHERAIASFEIEERRLIVGISHQLVGAELPGMLRRLGESDPKLRIELRAGGSREIVQSYDAGELDAALVLQAAAPHHKGERLFDEAFAWIGAAGWHPQEGQPLPLSTQGASCSIRAAAVAALDRAGIAWTEAFVGKGAAMVGAAAAAGLAIAVMARRAAPAGT